MPLERQPPLVASLSTVRFGRLPSPRPVMPAATLLASPPLLAQNLYMALKLNWLPLTVWLDAEFFSW
ncbi:hypothetical protein SAMN04487785_10963 [Dyella jiangningensis]|nr:hypothetical protein SAMN04487785_10963 [Dyella jiangningensis]